MITNEAAASPGASAALHVLGLNDRSYKKTSRSTNSLLVIFLTFLALVSGTWITIKISVDSMRSAEYKRMEAELDMTARVFTEQVIRSIKNVENQLDFLAHELLRDPRPERLKELVDARIISLDTLIQLAYVDAQARTLSTDIGPDPALTLLTDREHIRVHLDRLVDGLFVGKPVKGRVSGKWSIQITRAIKDRDNKLHGVIVASLDPFYFERFWKAKERNSGIEIELLGLDGVLRARSSELVAALDARVSRSDLVARSLASDSVQELDASIYGEARYMRAVVIDEYKLLVAASLPSASHAVRVNEQRWQILFIGYGATLALTAMFLWLCVFSASLRASERKAVVANERLINVIETMPNAFSLFDRNGRLLLRNAELFELMPEFCAYLDQGNSLRSAHEMTGAVALAARLFKTDRASIDDMIQVSERSIQLRAFKTPDDGWTTSWSDVTHLKAQEEEALRQTRILKKQAIDLERLAAEAQQAGAVKSAFLASMSHEIRTPLHAIIGFTDLLAKGDLSATQRERVSVIRASGRHLCAIVDDILDFSQIQSGKILLARQTFDVILLAHEATEIAAQLICGKPIALLINTPQVAEFWITGDRRRILQCLLNLLSNAIKFTDSGTVTLDVVFQSISDLVVEVSFTIRDTGIGISDSMQDFVLEPFNQDRARPESVRGGTGLGLSITRDLVRLMEGSFELKSQEGVGSEVCIRLPLLVESRPMTDDPDASRMLRGALERSLRILLVEDMESARMFAKLLLEARGHIVTECNNGLEAFKLVARDIFDIVLMDIQMPIMNGLEATRRIRALPEPQKNIFIIALTAQALEEEMEAALEAGMNSVLHKPFNEKALADALETFCCSVSSQHVVDKLEQSALY